MRKYGFFNRTISQISRKIYTYRPRIEAGLNYHLYVNSGLNKLSEYQKHIKGSESSHEFILLRDNYCLRTMYTPINLTEVLRHALILRDYDTASLICRNLHEESGEGNCQNAHQIYMLDFFNILSRCYFKTNTIDLADLQSSKYINESTKVFVRDMSNLYSSEMDYLTKIGAILAHESTAPSMLKLLHKILKPHITTLSIEDQKECIKYIDCHLNGTEQRHGEDMLIIADRLCQSESHYSKINDGINFFHSRQSHMWKGLINDVELLNGRTHSMKT